MPQLAVHEAETVDWDAVDRDVADDGGAIVRGLFDAATIERFAAEVDEHIASGDTVGLPDTGDAGYDRFLGHRTRRLHGLLNVAPSSEAMIADERVVAWADRTITSGGMQLNAAEYIEIGAGEPAQFPHRDTDSWPTLADHDPIIVNAIVAIDETTLDNGATWIAPGSHRWDRDRRVVDREWTRATLAPGDAVMFRGDVVHRGGANDTDRRRRVVSLSYCADWLRTVENNYLNVERSQVASASPLVQRLLGYTPARSPSGGLIGLQHGEDPTTLL